MLCIYKPSVFMWRLLSPTGLYVTQLSPLQVHVYSSYSFRSIFLSSGGLREGFRSPEFSREHTKKKHLSNVMVKSHRNWGRQCPGLVGFVLEIQYIPTFINGVQRAPVEVFSMHQAFSNGFVLEVQYIPTIFNRVQRAPKTQEMVFC